MGSDTLAVRIAGVHDTTLEFWAAELPQGPDGSFVSVIGWDHPALALMLIAGSANHRNALAQALEGVRYYEREWLAEHTDEFVTSMTLIATARAEWHTNEWIAGTIQQAGSSETSRALALQIAPRALYRVTVRDPAWLAHLRPGQEFGSTAYSPFPLVPRDSTGTMTTPGAWDPVLAVMRAPIDERRIHMYRNGLSPGSWCIDYESDRTAPSNRVRELFLRLGEAQFVYFDATAPRFNRAKFPFAERKQLLAPAYKMWESGAAAGPRGFHLKSRVSQRHEDGVARMQLDDLCPGKRHAWLEVEGEPRVRFGDWSSVDPSSPSVDVDDYLRDVAERVRLDLATP
ncbi:MAG TPA: hypothetical protein VGB85_00465 [Nannocystis sp.]|jgi:hypothetical protein